MLLNTVIIWREVTWNAIVAAATILVILVDIFTLLSRSPSPSTA